ncbi:MAG: carbamate kinase [Candidatus Nomurabacteria bacterium]|nr:carbamate kinase [Candidatus Nomurabacteria bacterium]
MKKALRVVVALGGNALQTSSAISAEDQKRVASETAKYIVDLIQSGYEIVIGHGNGPQVGDILLAEEASGTKEKPAMPLETDVAMSQGQIGYWLQQAIENELAVRGIKKSIATVVTQVLVNKRDQAFKNPSKPIGPFYTEREAKDLAKQRGWTVKEDSGRGWRRVVPSPKPTKIVEEDVIKKLIKDGIIPITVGGGGVPVVKRGLRLKGVDAVIDKDMASMELARAVKADIFMPLTAVDSVKINYGTPNEESIGKIDIPRIKRLMADGHFAAGSMLPKVKAAIAFVESRRGNKAIITSPNNALKALGGDVGTTVTN